MSCNNSSTPCSRYLTRLVDPPGVPAGEPELIADALAKDAAVQAADTLLLTVPSQLGVDYNAAMLETIAREIAPALGWSPNNQPDLVQ